MKQPNKNYRDREQSKVSQWDAAKYYLSQLRRWPLLSLPPFVLTTFGTLGTVYIPALIIAKVLERLAGGVGPDDTWPLLQLIMLSGGIMLLGELLWRFGLDLMSRFQVKAIAHVSDDAFRHYMAKSLGWHADNFAGALVTKASRLISNSTQFHDTLIFNVADFVVSFIFVAVILLPRAPVVFLTFCFIWLVFVYFVRFPIRRRARIVKARTRAESEQTAALADSVANISIVKAMAREDYETKLFKRHTKQRADLTLRSWLYQIWRVDTIIAPFYVAVNILSLILAVIAVTRWSAPVDSVFLTYSYMMMLSRRMWEFNRVWRNFETQLSEAANALEVLRAPVELVDIPQAEQQTLAHPQGEVQFHSVNFGYLDNTQRLFHKLDLTVSPGEKIGLVGPSGGGKTTIVKLLLRFIDVTDGSITIDGVDLRHLSQTQLRQLIAYVPQEPSMFHRTIADNIRYGRLDATDEEVKKAAKLAHADEFVKRLPQGYDTYVGERGVKLSGGQRQRVAIARAMLRQSPILLLDEATSALDSKSEKLIAEGLDNLMKGRTTIVIAHRLSTIRRLDRIIVMDDGEIVEEGTHDELLAQKGKYHELWSHQSGDFL